MPSASLIVVPTLTGNVSSSLDVHKLSRIDWYASQDNAIVAPVPFIAVTGLNESLSSQDTLLVSIPSLALYSSSVSWTGVSDVFLTQPLLLQPGESEFVSTSVVDFYEIPSEERNKSTASADNPSPLQGIESVTWEYFPESVTVESEEADSRARDVTRFRKAYSFTRQQPVRVRFVRR